MRQSCGKSGLTRNAKNILEKIADAGYGKDILESLQKMIDAENGDLLMFSRMCPLPFSRSREKKSK